MAVEVQREWTYNYESFTRSEGAGRSSEFKNQLRAGDAAPDFELPTLDGQRVRLSQFQGQKHVLLEREEGQRWWPVPGPSRAPRHT